MKPYASKRRKHKCHRRRAARDRLMPELLKLQSNTCYWCGCDIARIKDTPRGTEDRYFGVLRLGEGHAELVVAIATLDHLSSVFVEANAENTVAACLGCNAVRDVIARGCNKATVRELRRRFGKQGISYSPRLVVRKKAT